MLAHVHARLALFPEAKAAVDLTRDDVAVLPFDQEWLYGMGLLAETSALLGDAASAAVLYRLLVPWAAFNAAISPRVQGLRCPPPRPARGDDGALQRSEQHFEEARAMNARTGARPWLANTQADYARMLATRGQTGDRDRAVRLQDAALAAYRELGMERYAGRVAALV